MHRLQTVEERYAEVLGRNDWATVRYDNTIIIFWILQQAKMYIIICIKSKTISSTQLYYAHS
jgi:hypothetical protein